MHAFNSIVGFAVGAFMELFRRWPFVGLVVISAVASVGILLIFKAVSNQDRLDAVKRRIHASLFEIRLFNDDLRAISRAQVEILRHNLSYLRLQLVPLVFILPPVVVLLAQLQPYYGYRGLEIGQPVLLKVELRPQSGEAAGFSLDEKPSIALEVPPGLELETPAVWIPSKGELAWRISARESGDYEIAVGSGGEAVTKRVVVSDRMTRRSPRRVSSVADQFLYPVEQPLPSSGPLRSITLEYPEDPEILLMPRWMWIFFLLTVVFAFALKKPLKVTL